MTEPFVLLASLLLAVAGLSQLYAPHLWQAYYAWLASRGVAGVRLNGLISLGLGGIIVSFHNIWSGPPLLLTLLGWLLLLESAMCLFAPRAGLASLSEVEGSSRASILKGTGVVLIVVSGVLGVHAVTSVG